MSSCHAINHNSSSLCANSMDTPHVKLTTLVAEPAFSRQAWWSKGGARCSWPVTPFRSFNDLIPLNPKRSQQPPIRNFLSNESMGRLVWRHSSKDSAFHLSHAYPGIPSTPYDSDWQSCMSQDECITIYPHLFVHMFPMKSLYNPLHLPFPMTPKGAIELRFNKSRKPGAWRGRKRFDVNHDTVFSPCLRWHKQLYQIVHILNRRPTKYETKSILPSRDWKSWSTRKPPFTRRCVRYLSRGERKPSNRFGWPIFISIWSMKRKRRFVRI